MEPLVPNADYVSSLQGVATLLRRLGSEVEAHGRPTTTASPTRLDHLTAALSLQRYLGTQLGRYLPAHLQFVIRQAVAADYPTGTPAKLLDRAAAALEERFPESTADWVQVADVALRGVGIIP